jgi:hypothetical protein
MLNTDANTLQGLAQLSPSVKELLGNELLLALDRLCDATDPVILHQLQGRARMLKELLNLIEQAENPARQTPDRRVVRHM